MKLTVSKFAKLADTTVRTLRHYRQLGILVPTQKNENDHYIYVNEDFKRLHEIQLLQSLGLSLNEIKVCFENPKYSFKEIIRVQEQSLQQRREAIDYSLALIKRIQLLTEQDQLLESNSEILMLLMNSMRVEKAQKSCFKSMSLWILLIRCFQRISLSKRTWMDNYIICYCLSIELS
ncbi:MerR family transcriptional regulator [Paenibacillus sp. 1A_MP2]|uniref:MerR family transcriptional regulator n=1 Tax=Paenibacillus sp. 1A_MP2 TaxID=3457495 RepID=UPI003FCE986C